MREKFGSLAGMGGMLAKILPEGMGGDLADLLKALNGPADIFHAKLVEFRNIFHALLELDYAAGIGDRSAEAWHNPDASLARAYASSGQNPVRQDHAEGQSQADLAAQVSKGAGADSRLETQVPRAVDAPGVERSAILQEMAQG